MNMDGPRRDATLNSLFFSYGQVFGLMVVVLYRVSVSVRLITLTISKQLKHTVAKYVISC